jgi:hypothetical protein
LDKELFKKDMNGIRLYQRIAQRMDGDESFTCSFAEEIVRNTNKTSDKNFLMIREFPVRSVGITRAMRRSYIAIVEVIEMDGGIDKVILIIECKSNDSIARKALPQLTGYMRDVECTHGVSMSPNIALLYIDEDNNLPSQIGGELNLNTDNGIDEFINYVSNI